MNYPRLWLFDPNYRIYRTGTDGRAIGGPIWREHWREAEIVGENRASWLTSFRRKVPKKGGPGIAFSEEDIDREAFIKENRHRIADAVSRCHDHDTLQAIAKLVGIAPRDTPPEATP